MDSLSVLSAIFPGKPGLAGYIGAKNDGSGGLVITIGAVRRVKLQSDQSFLQAGCPRCCPTDSIKALKGTKPSCIAGTIFYWLDALPEAKPTVLKH